MPALRLAIRSHTLPFDRTPWPMSRFDASARSDALRREHLVLVLVGVTLLGIMLLGVAGVGVDAATPVLDVDVPLVLQ